jgi:hypothetical protein
MSDTEESPPWARVRHPRPSEPARAPTTGPGVAIVLALVMAPIATGLIEMAFFRRLWFFPNPTLKYAVGFFLLVYYASVFLALAHLGGARRPAWRDFGDSIRERLALLGSALLGLLMFGFVSVRGVQMLGGALLTANGGEPATRTYRVLAIDDLNPSARCGAKIMLRRDPGGEQEAICIAERDVDPAWQAGARVALSGRESEFGFYAERIGIVPDARLAPSVP